MSEEFGRVLKAIRIQYNEKQIDMAKKLEISDSYLSLVEKGKRIPTRKFLDKLYKTYNIDGDSVYSIEKLLGTGDDYLIVNIAGLKKESKELFLKFIASFNYLSDNQKEELSNIILRKEGID